jgi:hypothetical protein
MYGIDGTYLEVWSFIPVISLAATEDNVRKIISHRLPIHMTKIATACP